MAEEIPHSICNYCEAIPPTPALDAQAKSASKSQCGIKNTAISNALWNGSLYGKSVEVITENYDEDFYNDTVSPQANPSIWTITATKAFDESNDCTTSTVQEGFDQTFYVFPTAQPVPVVTNTTITESYTNPATGSRSDITTFSEQATNAGLENVIDGILTGQAWSSSTATAAYSETYSSNAGGPTPYYSALSKTIVRYRYRIPEGTNTYMKYVVEETFTPADYDAQDPLSPQPTTEEKTLTWTGPGTVGDDDSWATAWQTMDITTSGTKAKRLVKYQFYTDSPWVYT